MIIYSNTRSKKKKSKTKKEIAEYNAWLDSINNQKTNFSRGLSPKKPIVKQNIKPYIRETPYYPSKDTGLGQATKPIHGKVYTGTAMKGIGTLHKSNAVPIFTDEEARDQASMRR